MISNIKAAPFMNLAITYNVDYDGTEFVTKKNYSEVQQSGSDL